MTMYDRDKAGDYDEPGFTIALGRPYFVAKLARYQREGNEYGVKRCEEALTIINAER
jgi:hypothetical protein